ncbi:MAG: hypothetical protein JNN15_12790 [Blastocatellia bacterium]|nr:hypothetical protein [Blastocatellia bacterium]
MDLDKVIAFVTLLLTLSTASEKLVEIVKNLFPFLMEKDLTNSRRESRRCATIHLLTVLAGIATAFLSRSAFPQEILDTSKDSTVVGLGLLASGGSSLWNSLLSYLLKVKDIKSLDLEERQKLVEETKK